MRKSITVLFAACIFLGVHGVFAQTTDTTQQRMLKHAIDSIMNEKNYTRIPNKDFDEFIDSKIAAKINEKISYWFTAISIFITALAGLATYAFNNKIKQLISERITALSEKNMEDVRKYISDSRKITLRSDLEVMKNKIMNSNNVVSEANIIETRRLMEEIKESRNPELLSDVIDVLASVYYSNRNPKEIEKLIESNESLCEIKETTYMNAAILYMDLYELDGSTWYKENCLKYCSISAKKVPQYGEPQGITLLVYGVDYVNNPDPDIKKAALKNAKILIGEILTGSDFLTAYYTVDRLNRDKKNKVFQVYILELEKALPDDFDKLYARAKDYADRKNKAAN